MAIICPTVTAAEPHEFRAQIERLLPFAERIHLDLADGTLTENKLVDLEQIWLPENVTVDLHLMFANPENSVQRMIELNPSLVIIHAEAKEPFEETAKELKTAGLRVGLAVLQDTSAEELAGKLDDIDHILIFSGDLGHFGGKADFGLLAKVEQLKTMKPSLEFGWDGGINDQVVRQLVEGGIDVLNTGGYIQRAPDPAIAYAKLKEIIQEV